VRGLMIPLPTRAEMIEITRRIDAAFNWLDRVTAEHANASRLLPKLDHAILTKAFRTNSCCPMVSPLCCPMLNRRRRHPAERLPLPIPG
jgi:hypothetical protein